MASFMKNGALHDDEASSAAANDIIPVLTSLLGMPNRFFGNDASKGTGEDVGHSVHCSNGRGNKGQ